MAAAVTLHIYDVTDLDAISTVNKALKLVGTGAFHGAVEVYGQEWSFGYNDEGSGVFGCPPKGCDMHKYRESVDMPATELSEAEVEKIIERMSAEWDGPSYDLLRRNCCTFSDAFCVELGVGNVPKWVTNLAGAGATLSDGFSAASSQATAVGIIAAAKASEIDEKYQLKGTFEAKAKDVLNHDITQKAGAAVVSAFGAGMVKLQALDQQHSVTEKTGAMASAAVGKVGGFLSGLSGFSAAAAASEKSMTEEDKKQADEIKTVFKQFDLNGDGLISKEELMAVFSKRGWTEEEMEEVWSTCDENGDGKVDYDEFVNWVMGGDSSKYTGQDTA